MLKQTTQHFVTKPISVITGSVLIILTLVISSQSHVMANPSATFTATDESICGTGQSWYAMNCGSGIINVSSDTTEIVYYLNGNEVGTNLKSGGFTGYSVKASTLTNGIYHLSATAYNAQDQTGTVLATDGNSYLTFTVANAPSAKFTATDEGKFGSAPGTEGNVFSTSLTDVSSGVVQVVYYLDGAEVAVDAQPGTNNGYSVDTTTLTNGVYTLTATVQDSSGDKGTVYAEDGNASLTFTVDNSAAPSGNDQTCNTKQQDLNTITTNIVNRSESQLQTIDSVAKAVEEYYSKQTQKLSDYGTITSQLTSDENTTQVDLTNMVAESVIDCNGDLQSQLTQFTSSVTTVQTDISNYIKDVQSLISQLEGLS